MANNLSSLKVGAILPGVFVGALLIPILITILGIFVSQVSGREFFSQRAELMAAILTIISFFGLLLQVAFAACMQEILKS